MGEQAKAAKGQLDEISKRLEETEAAINRLKNEKKTAQDEELELQERLEQERESTKKEKKRLTGKIQELTNLIETAPKGDAKSEDLKKLEDQIKELEAQTKAVEEARAKAEAQSVEFNAALEEAKNRLAAAQQENAALSETTRKSKAELDALNRALDKEEDARALLEAKNRHAAAEVEDLKRRISAFAGDAGRTSELTSHYKTENVGLKKELEEFEKDNRMLSRELKALRAKLEELIHQTNMERAGKQRLLNGNSSLKKLVMDRSLANSELMSQLRSTFELEKAGLEAQITQLEDRRKRLAAQLSK